MTYSTSNGPALVNIEEIDGGAGNDTIIGTAGNDTIEGAKATTSCSAARVMTPSWYGQRRPRPVRWRRGQ